jgi:hypothetical protein
MRKIGAILGVTALAAVVFTPLKIKPSQVEAKGRGWRPP